MIKLNLTALAHARVGRRQIVDIDVGDLEVGELHLAYLKGELHLTRVAEGILAEGTLRAEVETTCTRCLEPFFEPISIELEDLINLPGVALTPECPVRIAEGGWVDLTPLIRQYAWLELPLNPLCSPDCQGLCPECGGNLNRDECVCQETEPIDPRWEALRPLLEE
ncbi:MAG: YceD family protein [Anaerolineae bacterium]